MPTHTGNRDMIRVSMPPQTIATTEAMTDSATELMMAVTITGSHDAMKLPRLSSGVTTKFRSTVRNGRMSITHPIMAVRTHRSTATICKEKSRPLAEVRGMNAV